jgi:hypothetical protein
MIGHYLITLWSFTNVTGARQAPMYTVTEHGAKNGKWPQITKIPQKRGITGG